MGHRHGRRHTLWVVDRVPLPCVWDTPPTVQLSGMTRNMRCPVSYPKTPATILVTEITFGTVLDIGYAL